MMTCLVRWKISTKMKFYENYRIATGFFIVYNYMSSLHSRIFYHFFLFLDVNRPQSSWIHVIALFFYLLRDDSGIQKAQNSQNRGPVLQGVHKSSFVPYVFLCVAGRVQGVYLTCTSKSGPLIIVMNGSDCSLNPFIAPLHGLPFLPQKNF